MENATRQVIIIDEAQELTAEQQQALLDELETEPTSNGLDKCDHGVYKAGEETARYCTLCNPDSARIIAPRKRIPEVKHIERVMDAAEFLDMPVGARLAASSRWLTEN